MDVINLERPEKNVILPRSAIGCGYSESSAYCRKNPGMYPRFEDLLSFCRRGHLDSGFVSTQTRS